MRWLTVILVMIGPTLAGAQIADNDVRLELVLEERVHPPHAGEMILLAILGTYKVPVVRENLLQSSLVGFDWMQLGEDRWYKAREDGFEVLKFERRMALFSQGDGPRTIDPFTHNLELLSGNQTVDFQEASNALTLDAKPLPSTDIWWFPVRKLEVSDQWSNQPEMLQPGAAALRVVALTVEGTAPQRIPPMPELTGAGAFIFPHPEHRIVVLGPEGPVTRVFWRWTIRPKEGSAGYLNPVDLHYFDAETREMKTIKLSAQRVAYEGGPQNVTTQNDSTGEGSVEGGQQVQQQISGLPRWMVGAATVIGFVAGLIWVFWNWGGVGFALPSWLRPDPFRQALRTAARRGDAKATWAAARKLSHGLPWPGSLRQLDAALFSNKELPDLKVVARDVFENSQRN